MLGFADMAVPWDYLREASPIANMNIGLPHYHFLMITQS